MFFGLVAGIAGLSVACSAARGVVFEWEPANTGGSSPVDAGAGAAGGGGMGGPGGSGSGGVAGPGAGGMVSPADPTLDPEAAFDWTATLPSRGTCTGGRFSGTFSCDLLNAPLLPIPSRVEGTIVLDLIGPTEAQTLDVERGTINVITASPMSFDAGVEGAISCADNGFSGKLREANVTQEELGPLITFLWNVMTPNTTVQGDLVGRLDAQSLSLTGEIMMNIGGGMCRGPFDLRAQL